MVVEDTTAFVEQLEVLIDDKRAAKNRRRVERVRLEVLELLAEIRLATDVLRDTQLSDRAGSSREVRALGSRIHANREALGRKRERLKRLEQQLREVEARRRTVVIFRLHSQQHYVDCSDYRFARMSSGQATEPMLVLRRGGRQWWWYRDRFWWDDARLSPRELEIALDDSYLAESLQRHLFEEARNEVFSPAESLEASEPIPKSVRLAVWRREQGRCVDCGASENVRFERVMPPLGDVPSPHDVELRCSGCSALRTQPRTTAVAWDLAEG